MADVLEILAGPLGPVEASRSASRLWVVVFRWISGLIAAGVAAIVVWSWSFQSTLDVHFQPLGTLQTGLCLVAGMGVTWALVLALALLAATFSDEKTRQGLLLVLAARVSGREIVSGRLLGRLAVVGTICLAMLPALALLASFADLGMVGTTVLAILPLAVAFGSGGLAVAASVASRRGRDALVTAYLLQVFLLLGPVYVHLFPALPPAWISDLFDALSPYAGIAPLVYSGETWPIVGNHGAWLLIGTAGMVFAAVRLRPACLRAAEGALEGRKGRRRRVPPVGDRPIVWKELYIERMKSVNRLFQLAGGTVLVFFVGITVMGAILIGWARLQPGAGTWGANSFRVLLGEIARHSWPVAWLMECSLGVRAAVTIASERERGTWDALLMSPLEGREIITGKIYGAIYALRWLIVALVAAWGIDWVCGALNGTEFLDLAVRAVVVGVFLVTVGVNFSLKCTTATKAMALTVLVWMAAVVGFYVAAAVCTGLIGLAAYLALVVAAGGVNAASVYLKTYSLGSEWITMTIMAIEFCLYGLAAFVNAVTCWRAFDRMAGRVTEPAVQVRRRRR